MEPSLRLDLRGTPCPLNFIRTKLSLETLQPGAWLQVDLDGGEPEQMVASGLEQAGHTVRRQSHPTIATAVRLLIRRDGL
ncbi:sulfurtransferase TusA family protein [Aphanothece stagnina]